MNYKDSINPCKATKTQREFDVSNDYANVWEGAFVVVPNALQISSCSNQHGKEKNTMRCEA
jgi:hypothetical protein